MNKLKNFGVAALVTLGSFAVLAEETGGTSGTGGGTSSIVESAESTLSGVLTSAGAAVSTLVLSGLAIWAGIAIIGLIKRAFNAGKGR